jgi:hypothetical protein
MLRGDVVRFVARDVLIGHYPGGIQKHIEVATDTGDVA